MKTIYILPLLLLFTTLGFSQKDYKEKKEKIKALKVAYITEQLELTTEEAQKFWPVYNAYDDAQFEIRHTKMRNLISKDEDNIDNLSEKEAKELVVKMQNLEKEMHNLRQKYYADLLKVLPAKKIVKLKKTEEDFNRKLIRQLKDK
jgi:Spy/CpxP family protein refolding chaperone